MKFEDIAVGFDDGITITFKLPISAREEVEPILGAIEKFNPEQDYNLSLTRASKKRSMDANAYMWVLCDKIAQVIKVTKEEVYRRAIREAGVFEDVVVLEGEPCAFLISTWGNNGIGFFAEPFETELTALNGKPMKRVRLYKGSHDYTQAQLSRVIDWVVEEAKALEIPTMTEDKIKEMEASWK